MRHRPYKDAALRRESSTGTTLMRYVRIAVLAAVLCGGVAWVLWRPSGAGDPARSPALSSRSTGSEAPSNAAGGKRTPRGEGKLPDVSSPPSSSHLTSLPQHSIAGWVLNEAGEPVPGIALVASAQRLEQRPVQGAPAQRSHGHQTETDAAGFFRLLALADGEYDVRTVATKRYAVAQAVLRAGVQSAVLVLKEGVEQEVYVYGIVESTAGKPLEGVRVLPLGQGPQHTTSTDKTGNYGLQVTIRGHRQNYAFRFMREGYKAQRLTLSDPEVSGGQEEAVRLNVRLDPIGTLATVTGTVRDSHGSPVALTSLQLFSASVKRNYKSISTSAGSFLFPAVEPAADYRLQVRPYERYKAYIEEGLEITAEGLELPVELEPQRTSRLAGWMVDMHGNPIPQFSLWLRNTSVTVPPFVQVTGDQRGYFVVEEVPEGQLSFQTLAVPHLNVSGIELPPDTATEVQLTLDWGNYEANGYVLTAAGDPVPGAQVALRWNDDDRGIHSRSSRRTITDSKGYFLFTQLGPGLHTLTIHAPGFRSAQLDYEVRASGGEVLVHLDAQSPPKRSSAVP